MIDEVSETLGWERKHTIKALNGKVTLGVKAQRRGSKATHGEEERSIIVRIWKQSEQPCGVRLKATLPLWMESYAARYGTIKEVTSERILSYSARTLERARPFGSVIYYCIRREESGSKKGTCPIISASRRDHSQNLTSQFRDPAHVRARLRCL